MSKMDKYVKIIFDKFKNIGNNDNGNGVTRLGYSPIEDAMHSCFIDIVKSEGLNYYTDEVGNSYAYLRKYDKYDYIGSHLDSVVEGGKFDGVLGVSVGLAILLVARDEEIDIPIKVVALRCEESSNFMVSMVGSKLITDNFDRSLIGDMRSLDGIYLKDLFKERSYSFYPKPIDDIKKFIELHIEQGRVLETEKKQIGIVNTIAGTSRFVVDLKGFAEHSGATPMSIRQDSLCAAADIILNVEKIGKIESGTSVGTVGYISNTPNSMNVVPGETKISIDFRDISNESMNEMQEKIRNMINRICTNRSIKADITEFPITSISDMNKEGIQLLEEIAKDNNYTYKIMPSGAGHDAMIFSKIVDTNLIFIPCQRGISHNPKEKANLDDAVVGANLILEYLERINNVN